MRDGMRSEVISENWKRFFNSLQVFLIKLVFFVGIEEGGGETYCFGIVMLHFKIKIDPNVDIKI